MLRLTGGEFRGRLIQTPANDHVRPTQARLRQAWFNSLQTVIPEAKVLDLFAGSGALGFEALSRGATSVVFVEKHRGTAKILEKNIATLRVDDRATLIEGSVDEVLARIEPHAPFDLVLADPPYAAGWEEKLLNEMPWDRWLVEDGSFCLEWGVTKSQVADLPERTPFLVKVREKNYGDSVLTTYRRTSQ